MMHVMRKYEKYIYLFITFIIVISFSFFGTYGTIENREIVDPVVFTTVDGTQVTKSSLEEMVRFLETDNEDKLLSGGAWGPNFLNNGVIKNDIIDKNIAYFILTQYQDQLKSDFETRFAKEKNWRPYQHPQAEFISMKNLLAFAAPDAVTALETLQGAESPMTPEAIKARLTLFNAHRKLSPSTVYQVLMQQQRQQDWIKPDPNLGRGDLSLFGYNFLNDWFGPKFLTLSAEFVMNAAAIAEERGYRVSKEEVLADLARNADMSFRQLQGSPDLGVTSAKQYFEEQMRRMGMDQTKVVKLWRQVMLFRRLFDDVATSAVIDQASLEPLWSFYNQDMKGELYELPRPFRFKDARDLERFEVYLAAVSDHKEGDLSLPNELLSVDAIQKKNPEFVEQKLKAEIKEVSLKSLQGKVSIKQMWEWEGRESSWELLKKEFPELAEKKAKTPEERLLALDALDPKTRIRVDTFAREKIVQDNPKWVDEELAGSRSRTEIIGLREKGGTFPFAGVEKRKELIDLLMKQEEIKKFSEDKKNFYSIKVLERTPQKQVLSFEQASLDGTLDVLVKEKLKDQAVDVVFAPIIKAITDDYNKATGKKDKLIPAIAASLRFYQQARQAQELVQKGGELKPTLGGQFYWVMNETTVDNQSLTSRFDATQALTLKPGEWTDIITPANGNLQFFKLKEKQVEKDSAYLVGKTVEVQSVLRDEAKGKLAEKLIQIMKEKNALTTKWMES